MKHLVEQQRVDLVLGLVNVLLKYRDQETYVQQNSAVPLFEDLDIAQGDLIDGNFGRMAFVRGADVYGLHWHAPSYALVGHSLSVTAGTSADEVLFETEDHKIGFVCEVSDVSGCAIPGARLTWAFDPLYSALPSVNAAVLQRTHDSEYLLVNRLGFELLQSSFDFAGERAVLMLVSERIPCPSCTHVIKQFLAAHPLIDLDLVYLYDSGNKHPKTLAKKKTRGPGDFLEDLNNGVAPVAAFDSRVRLTKAAIHNDDALRMVEVVMNSVITMTPEARKQSLDMGEPPGISLAIAPSEPGIPGTGRWARRTTQESRGPK